jgi:hypothetical protein
MTATNQQHVRTLPSVITVLAVTQYLLLLLHCTHMSRAELQAAHMSQAN